MWTRTRRAVLLPGLRSVAALLEPGANRDRIKTYGATQLEEGNLGIGNLTTHPALGHAEPLGDVLDVDVPILRWRDVPVIGWSSRSWLVLSRR